MKILIVLMVIFSIFSCSDNSLYNFTGYVPNLDINRQVNVDTLTSNESYIYKSEEIGAAIKYYFPDGDKTQDSIIVVYKLYDKWGRLDSIYDRENNIYKKYKYDGKNHLIMLSVHGKENFTKYFRYDSDYKLISIKEIGSFTDFDSIVTEFTYNYALVKEERKLQYSDGEIKVVYDNIFDESGNIIYSIHDNIIDTLSYEFKDNFFHKYLVKSGSKKLLAKYRLNNNNEIIQYIRYDALGKITSNVNLSYSGDQITIDSTRFSGGEEVRRYHVEKKTDGRMLRYEQYNSGVLFIKKVYTYDGSNNLIKYEEFTKGDRLHKKFTRKYNEYNLPIEEKLYDSSNNVIKTYQYQYKKFL